LESVPQILKSLGLKDRELKIYIHLAKKGAKKAREISKGLKMDRVQLYRILKDLQKKGMVESTFEQPAHFTAVPFEKVLDLFIKSKKEETRILETKRSSWLSQWRSLEVKMESPESDKFMVIEGRNLVYSKIQQMIQETKDNLYVVTSSRGVVLAYQAGLLEAGFSHPLRNRIRFRFITSLSRENIEIIKDLIMKGKKTPLNVEQHHTDFGPHNFPRFVIKDDEELIFFLRTTDEESSSSHKDTGLWTNNRVLVRAFKAFFEELWSDSVDFFTRITEMEDEKAASETSIKDQEDT
jgi:sugar-specific transcriptional regulator TrmB